MCRRALVTGVSLFALIVATSQTVLSVQVWTPQTGEVGLEEQPRESPEQRRRHALGLIGAGQFMDGVFLLKELIQADPDGSWVPEARLAIGRALIGANRYEAAYEELRRLREEFTDASIADRARSLQFMAARQAARRDIAAALAIYDRLGQEAADGEEAAYVQKERGDALFVARRFLEAQDEYLTLINVQPSSKWVPYCWYKVADCEWEMARHLGDGVQRVREAVELFRDYLDEFPGHDNAREALKKVEEARQVEAHLYGEIARFYIEKMGKPWAAVTYLEFVCGQFPGTPEAAWAAMELNRIQEETVGPLRGKFRKLDLPGVQRRLPSEAPSGEH